MPRTVSWDIIQLSFALIKLYYLLFGNVWFLLLSFVFSVILQPLASNTSNYYYYRFCDIQKSMVLCFFMSLFMVYLKSKVYVPASHAIINVIIILK